MVRYHRGPFIQKGRGIGNFFRAIWRVGNPLVSRFLSSPLVKEVGKAAASTAVDVGARAVADALEGKKSIKRSLGEGVDLAKREIAAALRGNASGKNRRKSQTGEGYGGFDDSDGSDSCSGSDDGPSPSKGKRAATGKKRKATATKAKKRKRKKKQVGGGGRQYRGLFEDSPDEGDYGQSSDSQS
jgi:hypothetical protein